MREAPVGWKHSVCGRLAQGILGVTALACLAWPEQGRANPKRYDPDPQACNAETIRQTFLANLLPWQDQPAAVQERLRRLQGAMTLDTLRECESKGLLSAEQVKAMTNALGLGSPPASAKPLQGSAQPSTRP